MTFPVRDLNEAVARLDRYLAESRPLNLDEMSQVRDLIVALRENAKTVARHLRTQRLPLPPDVSLCLNNLTTAIGYLG